MDFVVTRFPKFEEEDKKKQKKRDADTKRIDRLDYLQHYQQVYSEDLGFNKEQASGPRRWHQNWPVLIPIGLSVWLLIEIYRATH